MGPLCNFPHSLKQLDLSHNQIENWPPCSSWDVLQLDEPLSPLSSSSPFSSSSSPSICYSCMPDRNMPKTPITTGISGGLPFDSHARLSPRRGKLTLRLSATQQVANFTSPRKWPLASTGVTTSWNCYARLPSATTAFPPSACGWMKGRTMMEKRLINPSYSSPISALWMLATTRSGRFPMQSTS